MLPYLIKLTIIWAVLLLCYEFLFSKTHHFKANRIYLFTAILSGIVIPFIPLKPFSGRTLNNNITVISNDIQRIGNNANTPAVAIAPIKTTLDFGQIIEYIYLAGMIIAMLMAFLEIVRILRTAIYGNYITVSGHKIFSSSKAHAPFSFMGWIFMSDPEHYSEEELTFILKHEDAHNRRYHWLDMILIQLTFVVFWFHPLVWRFRYLLKLNHEFEADQIAASENAYAYGHFLLAQTLLKGTPVIAHSFHFSPIKNRITMLTQREKSSGWKYVLMLPILFGCTILFAKSVSKNERIRAGNTTTFNGHKFYWNSPKFDSIEVEDPSTGTRETKIMQQEPRIYKMDNDSVYTFQQTITNFQTPKFRNEAQDISEYMTEQFKEKVKDALDTISQIDINNVVLDDKGKIQYYEILYIGRHFGQRQTTNAKLDPIVEDIVANCPAVETMSYRGAPQPTFMWQLGAVILHDVSGRVIKVKH